MEATEGATNVMEPTVRMCLSTYPVALSATMRRPGNTSVTSLMTDKRCCYSKEGAADLATSSSAHPPIRLPVTPNRESPWRR